MHGGAADRSGLISVGDEVIEVNGIPVEGKTPNDVLKILQTAESTITFKLIPNEQKAQVGFELYMLPPQSTNDEDCYLRYLEILILG